MECLHLAGRRHEALEVYQRARRILVDELGLEPSVELQKMQQAVLAACQSPPGQDLDLAA